jgi:hypothetical protein
MHTHAQGYHAFTMQRIKTAIQVCICVYKLADKSQITCANELQCISGQGGKEGKPISNIYRQKTVNINVGVCVYVCTMYMEPCTWQWCKALFCGRDVERTGTEAEERWWGASTATASVDGLVKGRDCMEALVSWCANGMCGGTLARCGRRADVLRVYVCMCVCTKVWCARYVVTCRICLCLRMHTSMCTYVTPKDVYTSTNPCIYKYTYRKYTYIKNT